MKKIYITLIFFSGLIVPSMAQVPSMINFQAILRGENGLPIENTSITVSVSFHHTSGGSVVYQESHSTSTDGFGLINLRLGSGTPSNGTFGSIDWSTGSVYFQAQATTADNIVVNIEQQQLVAVPFALHATTASSLSGEDDVDNTNELQALTLENNQLLISNGNQVDLSSLREDEENELQTLTFTDDELSISNGNQVNLSSLKEDETNEIQHLQLVGSTLTLTNSDAQINIAPYLGENTDEQHLQIDGDSLKITNGNAIGLDAIDNQTLQNAFNKGNSITLNDTTEFLINTKEGSPLLATMNSRLGVGTTNPNATLHVQSAGPDDAANLELSNGDDTHRLFLFPGRENDPNPFISVMPNDPIRFASYDGVNFQERMRIDSVGNIGLGVIIPKHRFHTNGQLNHISESAIEPLSTQLNVTFETGALFNFNEAEIDTITNVGVASVLEGVGNTNYGMLSFSKGTTSNSRGMYAAATGATTHNAGIISNAFGGAEVNQGARGIASGATNQNWGFYGIASGGATQNTGSYGQARGAITNIGGFFITHGVPDFTATTNYGIYANATGTATTSYGVYATASDGVNNYAGYFLGRLHVQGNSTTSGNATITGNVIAENDIIVNDEIKLENISIKTPGNNNLALGEYSLNTISEGENNVAMGYGTINNLSSGSFNVGIGYRAMDYAQSGNENIAIGPLALFNLSGSNQNVAIGRYAGMGINNLDDQNVLIGSAADVANDQLVQRSVALGHNAKVHQSDAVILGNPFNAIARVGIGTPAPTAKLHVEGDVLLNGTVTTVSISQTSDVRKKKEIKRIVDALETIQHIEGVSYRWKESNDVGRQHGVIAQQLEEILPDLVVTDKEGFKSVQYTALIPFLIEAIKEQQKQIDQLKTENEKIASLENKMNELTAMMQQFTSGESQNSTILTKEK